MAMVRFVRNNVLLTNIHLFYILALCDLRQTLSEDREMKIDRIKKKNKQKKGYLYNNKKRKKIDVAHVRHMNQTSIFVAYLVQFHRAVAGHLSVCICGGVFLSYVRQNS